MEEILKLLITTRDALAVGYDNNITEMICNADVPLEAVVLLERERDEVLGELDRRITEAALS